MQFHLSFDLYEYDSESRGHWVVAYENLKTKEKSSWVIPKVIMRYNFWSKLYFYMKFLNDVYCSIGYLYSEVQ